MLRNLGIRLKGIQYTAECFSILNYKLFSIKQLCIRKD